MSNEKFKARSGSLDFGHTYEFLMAAFYGLRFSVNTNVCDFKLSTNNNDMGNFDDVIVEVTHNDGQDHLYALQLKHRGCKEDSITLSSFDSEKGGKFGLKKYCAGFKQIEALCKNSSNYVAPFENFHFILFTNQILPRFHRFDEKHEQVEVDELKLTKNSNIIIYRRDKCVSRDLLNTSTSDDYFIFKFKTQIDGLLDEIFLNQFFLYTNQKDAKEMECIISKTIFDIYNHSDPSIVTNYLNFFKSWWRGDFGAIKLTKKDILQKLCEYVLAPHIPDVDFKNLPCHNETYGFFYESMQQFDLTFIQNSTTKQLHQPIWTALLWQIFSPTDDSWSWSQPNKNVKAKCLPDTIKIPIAARSESLIDPSLKKIYIILWHLGIIPMFIKVKDSSRNGIFKAIKLCHDNNIKKKFVVLDDMNFNWQTCKNCKVFNNLSDVCVHKDIYSKICGKLMLSLQGRPNITLKNFVESAEAFLNIIYVREIILMLTDNFAIGNCNDNFLRKKYIKRLIPKVLLDFDSISMLNDVVVISGSQYNTPKYNQTIELTEYLGKESKKCEDSLQTVPITTEDTCSLQQFEEVCALNPNKNCHHLRIINENRIEWLQSQNSITKLRPHQLNLEDVTDIYSVKDSEALHYFRNKINVICAAPGMGKSMLMKSLKQECPSSHWVINVNLIEHVKFFRQHHTTDKLIEYFLNESIVTLFVQEIVNVFSSRKKILFLWDGFDELPPVCQKSVILAIKMLSEDGYWQWISARSNSKEFLEDTFGVLSLTISPLTAENQNDYIYGHLMERYEDKDLVNVMAAKLYENMKLSLVCGYFDYSGVPLHIHMVTEIFLKNPNKYVGDFKVVMLTDIYRQFVEGRFNNFFKSASANNENSMMKKLQMKIMASQLPQYEVAALKASFDEDTFASFTLNCDSFLEEIAENKDSLEFICGVNDEKKPLFSHKTFEEYLTASWMVKNYSKYTHLVQLIFKEDYKNIRLMFDMLHAVDSPLHVAVLYRKLDVLKGYEGNLAGIKDLGGRNLLHIACAWASSHSSVNVVENGQDKIVIAANRNVIKPEENVEIIKFLLEEKCDPFEKDHLNNWDCVRYCDETLSLAALETVMDHKYQANLDVLPHFDLITFLYHAVNLKYANIFNHLSDLPYVEVESEEGHAYSLLYFAAKQNSLDFVLKLLTTPRYEEIFNTKTPESKELLTLAVLNGNVEMFNFLRKKGAKIDRTQMKKMTSDTRLSNKKFWIKLLDQDHIL